MAPTTTIAPKGPQANRIRCWSGSESVSPMSRPASLGNRIRSSRKPETSTPRPGAGLKPKPKPGAPDQAHANPRHRLLLDRARHQRSQRHAQEEAPEEEEGGGLDHLRLQLPDEDVGMAVEGRIHADRRVAEARGEEEDAERRVAEDLRHLARQASQQVAVHCGNAGKRSGV